MEKVLKKGRSFCLKAAVTGLGAAAIMAPIMASTQTAFASTGGKTATQAIRWVKSKVGTGIDYDGANGNQCVDLVKAYYAYLGQSAVRGNGGDYAHNDKPNGWARLQGVQPKKGDILVYTGGYGGYGHVGIYESDYSHFHQNWSGSSNVEHVTYNYDCSSSIHYWGVIRPDFVAESKPSGGSSAKTGKNGLVKVNGVWKYYKNGKVDKSYTGLAKSPSNGKWYYVKNGKINTSYTGLAKSPKNGKWYYVKNGTINLKYTGLAKSPKTGKWYYVKNGTIDYTYTGLAKSPKTGKLYYVKKGALNTSFSGKVTYKGKLYKVVKGEASALR